MVRELKSINLKFMELQALLKSGDVVVQIAEAEEKRR